MLVEELKLLLEKYRKGLCSVEELQQLQNWYDELNTGGKLDDQEGLSAEAMLADFKKLLAPVVPIRRRKWKLVAAAASIALLLASGIIFYTIYNKEKPSGDIANIQTVLPPDKTKASLTLADGTVMYIDSLSSGQLAMEGAMQVVKLDDGQLAYQNSDGSMVKELVYNTFTNPRGSKTAIINLSDGSKVWLNSGSSLSYPVAFVENERRVELEGEGYFEIAKDPLKRFIVQANGTSTEVLGTHFNVNAYSDEADTRITLLEGSVKVIATTTSGEKSSIIKPGQQARLTGTKELKTLSDVDIEEVMAWYNNEFVFENEDIHVIMRQLARWYDIEPVFTQKDKAYAVTNYTGRINKTVEITKVLEMFEKLGYIKFEINNKTVSVVPTNKIVQ